MSECQYTYSTLEFPGVEFDAMMRAPKNFKKEIDITPTKNKSNQAQEKENTTSTENKYKNSTLSVQKFIKNPIG